MDELRRLAEEHQCVSITLEVWEWNKEAIAFYKSVGMEPTMVRMKTWLRDPSAAKF